MAFRNSPLNFTSAGSATRARFLITLGVVSLAAGLLWPSEPDWFGSVARRLRDRTGEYDVLFPVDDVFAFERSAQPRLLGPEPLKSAAPSGAESGGAFISPVLRRVPRLSHAYI
jgi:hypothetical protein